MAERNSVPVQPQFVKGQYPARIFRGFERKFVQRVGRYQPAQSLSRGNRTLSSTSTSTPACRNCHAQVDPAGPPPTTMTSATCMSLAWLLSGVLITPGPGNLPVCGRCKKHLVQLKRTALKTGRRPGQVQSPRPGECLAIHCGHLVADLFEVSQPRGTGARVMRSQVFHVKH